MVADEGWRRRKVRDIVVFHEQSGTETIEGSLFRALEHGAGEAKDGAGNLRWTLGLGAV